MERFVSLLRGINVGGNNKIDMKRLKLLYEELELAQVKTYINSGNVVFESSKLDVQELSREIQDRIYLEYNIKIPVLVVSGTKFLQIEQSIPGSWHNNAEMKSDVLFLWDIVDKPEIVSQLKPQPGVDSIQYVPGALLWMILKKDYNRSSIKNLIGTRLYSQMTLRNVNTVRKLAGIIN